MSNDSSKPPADQTVPHHESEPVLGNKSFGYKLVHIIVTVFSGLALYLVPPVIAVVFFLPIILGLQAAGVIQSPISDMELFQQFLFVLGTEVVALLLLIVLMKANRETWRSIGVTARSKGLVSYIFIGFIIYYVLYIPVVLAVNALLQFDLEQRQELGFDTNVSGLMLLLPFISLVILPPIVEEIIFRGYLYTRFRRVGSVVVSAVIVSVVFGIAHLQIGSGNPLLWVAAIDTFILSLVLVWLREKTGAIWSGVGVHALKNGFAFYVLFIAL